MMRKRQFWLAIAVLIAVVVVAVGTYQRWWDLRFPVGPFVFTHWMVWIGAGYIAVFTPIYLYVKRRTAAYSKGFLTAHVFGNLVAFLLISLHFGQQVGRPPQAEPIHATGLILYIVVAAMVITGFSQRFRVARNLMSTWRFVHVSLTLTFYIVLVVHVLQYAGVVGP